jgi:hypothetical protein
MMNTRLPRILTLIAIACSLALPNCASQSYAQDSLPSADEFPFEDASPFKTGNENDAFSERDPDSTRSRGREGRERTIRPSDRGDAGFRPEEDIDDPLGSSQQVILNDRFAGWNEASDGLGDRRVGEVLRSNWVMVDPNGLLEGTVRPIGSARVVGMTVYLMNKGRLVKTAAVQEDGSFFFTNIQRGAYSLVGWGDNAFFAWGANILPFSEDADSSTPTKVNTFAFQNATTINTDWIRYFTPNVSYRVYGRYEVGEGENDPANLYGFRGLSNYQPSAVPSTSVGGTPVSLTADGRLIGRVHELRSLDGRPVDVRSTKVMLFERDSVVASTTTDNYGVFEFEGVPPGGYGLVAAGVDGVGMAGLVVTDADDLEMTDEGELSDPRNVGEPFDFCLTSSETAGWLNHYANEVSYQRAILAPRPRGPQAGNNGCAFCNGQCGASGVCNQCGQKSFRPEDAPCQCHSRSLTFGQWQQLGCARYSNGRAGIGNATRQVTDRINDVFERVFYPETGSNGITGGLPPSLPNTGRSVNEGFSGRGFQQPGPASQGFAAPTPAGSSSRAPVPSSRY